MGPQATYSPGYRPRRATLRLAVAAVAAVAALPVALAACAGPARSVRRAEHFVPASLRLAGCRSPAQAWAGFDLQGAGECLRQVHPPARLRYRLRRREEPYLELQRPAQAPACVRERLARLPVPREIVFQAFEEARLGCYVTELDLRADEWLGAKVPFRGRWELEIRLPLSPPPADEAAALRLLTAWTISPLWKAEGTGAPRVQVVPDAVCRRCLGERQWISPDRPDAPEAPIWPEGGGGY